MPKKKGKKGKKRLRKRLYKSEKFVTFSDLKSRLRENDIYIDNLKSLQKKVDKKLGDNSQINIPYMQVMPVKVAREILRILVGDHFKDYQLKYESERKVPLQQIVDDDGIYFNDDDLNIVDRNNSNLKVLEKISDWHLRVLEENPNFNSPLIGFACLGGFLKGEKGQEDEPFVFTLNSDINILIGDRGSGKSTALNLLSIPALSLRQKSDATDISKWFASKENDFHVNGIRRVWGLLKEYGVSEYVCFFNSAAASENEGSDAFESKLLAFYANTDLNIWCLAHHCRGSWMFSLDDPSKVFPRSFVLQQGDVFRIADARSKFAVSQLLLTLNQDLKTKQAGLQRLFDLLVEKAKDILERSDIDNSYFEGENFFYEEQEEYLRRLQSTSALNTESIPIGEKEYFKLNVYGIVSGSFIDQKKEEIIKLKRRPRSFDEFIFNIGILDEYIREAKKTHKLYEQDSLINVIRSGKDGFNYLYLGIISKYLQEKTAPVDDLLKKSLDVLGKAISSFYKDIEYFYRNIKSNSLARNLAKHKFSFFRRLVLVLEKMNSNHIIEFIPILEERFTIVLQIWRAFQNNYSWGRSEEIVKYLTAFVKTRNSFIENQRDYCKQIQEKLSFLEEQVIHIESEGSRYKYLEEAAVQNEKRFDLLTAPLRDESLSLDEANEHLRSVEETLSNYKTSMTKYFSLLDKIQRSRFSQKDMENFIYCHTQIKLRQGKTFKKYEQLSYGQRVGVILSLIVEMSETDSIIIDQPEDHLDSEATSKILIPTLIRATSNATTSRKKSFAIATHNLSLVLGLQPTAPYIFVMERPDEYSGKRHAGNLEDIMITNYLFEVLAGGLSAWTTQIKYFKIFMQILESIEDKHIQDTIAELRNMLQPKVTYKYRLNHIRHELRNIISSSISGKRLISSDEEKINSMESKKGSDSISFPTRLESLDKELQSLVDDIEKQDKEILMTVEKIRNVAIGENPEDFNLYQLLKDFEGHKQGINVEVDKSIQEIVLHANLNDIRIVFRNLIANSTLAITALTDEMELFGFEGYKGKISIEMLESNSKKCKLKVSDNGIGISPEIIEDLYLRRCSTRPGGVQEGHGEGAMMIASYLRENGGRIWVDQDNNHFNKGIHSGTVQIVEFVIREPDRR
ncbi:MAG: ATP-binding protein [Cyanobacteria bacterium P01_F01_bin.150]